jgi:hypothetical protein
MAAANLKTAYLLGKSECGACKVSMAFSIRITTRIFGTPSDSKKKL